MKQLINDAISNSNLSVTEIAKRLGVHRNTVHHWIRNPQSIRVSHALKLCEILHCSFNDLFEQEVHNGDEPQS